MSIIDDFNKTFAYLHRNGLRQTIDAVSERLNDRKVPYTFVPVTEEEIRNEAADYATRLSSGEKLIRFSILTPLYRTPEPFLREMLDSVRRQTYGNFELVMTADDADYARAQAAVREVCGVDERFVLVPVRENGGIAANTGAALQAATGDYIGLLDHDDLLCADALYRVEEAIRKNNEAPDSLPAVLVYTDEDKCDEALKHYFEPHHKPDFDPDYLYSNNYICHFTVIEGDTLRNAGFRSEYDGAQDYDVILRTGAKAASNGEGTVLHIPRILYHWRSSSASSAGSSTAKTYAYDAGRRAVSDYLSSLGIMADISELPHVGFHRIEYHPDVFTARSDIGVVGGKLTDSAGTLVGGKMSADGQVYYEGLPKGHSGGYQHPAVLQQQAEAVDMRCIRVRDELKELLQAYVTQAEAVAEATPGNAAARDAAYKENSVAFCNAVREKGYRILWDPQMSLTVQKPAGS